MKKLFKSAFSLSVALSLVSSAAPCVSFAENETAEYFEGSITGYELAEDIYETETEYTGESFKPDAPAFYAYYGDNAYNYGTFLDDNNVQVYMKFMELVNPSTDAIKINLPDPVSFEVSALPSSARFTDDDLSALRNAVYDSCWSGLVCATFDIPDLFWVDIVNTDINYSYTSTRNRTAGTYSCTINSITLTPNAYEAFSSFDDVLEYKEKLNDAIENFEVKGDTRYEKLKSIHDAMSIFTYYDMDAPFSGSVLGSLVQPGAVCESYSKAFKLMCDRLSIPCVCVFGNYNEENKSAHMWNYVLMDDNKWYAVDVTWDDRDGKNGVEYNYTYFLKGSGSFFKDHTPEEYYLTAHFVYPEISTDNYDPSFVPETDTSAETTTTETTTASASTTISTEQSTTSTAAETTTTEEKIISVTTTSEKPVVTTTVVSTTEETTTTTRKNPSRNTTTTTETTVTSTTASTAATTTEKADEFIYGDLNRDGICSVADLVYCSNTVLGKISPEYSCDINNDGFEDVFDVIIMRELVTEYVYILY